MSGFSQDIQCPYCDFEMAESTEDYKGAAEYKGIQYNQFSGCPLCGWASWADAIDSEAGDKEKIPLKSVILQAKKIVKLYDKIPDNNTLIDYFVGFATFVFDDYANVNRTYINFLRGLAAYIWYGEV